MIFATLSLFQKAAMHPAPYHPGMRHFPRLPEARFTETRLSLVPEPIRIARRSAGLSLEPVQPVIK
ncbi:hypothetical protein B4096_2180 [Heyndrickxia coagulans]|nr:hypothetical protein B4096_2180 [Heyndrickxia coagulans]